MARPKKLARTTVLRLTTAEADLLSKALDYLADRSPEEAMPARKLEERVSDASVLAQLATARRRKS